MDRVSRLRLRSSVGVGLNSSCQSIGNGAGYETANDESITSGSSLYYTIIEDGSETTTATTATTNDADVVEKKVVEDSSIDQTLENDFSVEEVSTIRKPMIMAASPATVKVASKMSCKYLGVSSTPAKPLRCNNGENLSGIEKLNETDEKKQLPSAMKKMREPKLSDCSSGEDAEESRMTLESSVQSVVGTAAVVQQQKSFGANVLADFFDSLDVNKATPVPQIKVDIPPEDVDLVAEKTPAKRRSSNLLQNFFESLKKDPGEEQQQQQQQKGKENRPQSERKAGVRKSLVPKATEERARSRSSNMGLKINDNRVATPIAKPSRKSSAVKLIPDRLKEMRKDNQSDLFNLKRKSIMPPPVKAVPPKQEPAAIGDSRKIGPPPNRKSTIPAPRIRALPPAVRPATTIGTVATKRQSVVPTTTGATSRKSVIPPPVKTLRRSVAPVASKVSLKVPAKTTINSSDTTRRLSLGKRSTTDSAIEPLAKQRKSLAPIKEAKTRISPKEPVKPASRIRPPSISSTTTSAFRKPESFTCDICQRPFRLKSSLATHTKLAHQNDIASPGAPLPEAKAADTKCRYCAKNFVNAKILSNHLISNCQKIPIPDKRKLLAEDDLQRASSSRSSPLNNGQLKRPSTSGSTTTIHSDTSASSSIGDTSANNVTSASGLGTSRTTSTAAASRKRAQTVGHTGITRTPKKEMKCHLCNRRFLIAVEYALHVQAHAKGVESLQGSKDAADGGEDAETPKNEGNPNEGLLHPNDANKIMQKLVKLGRKS